MINILGDMMHRGLASTKITNCVPPMHIRAVTYDLDIMLDEDLKISSGEIAGDTQ